MKDLYQLSDNLPVPVDDGACDHLEGMLLPALLLKTSSNSSLDLSAQKGIVVIFFYPTTTTTKGSDSIKTMIQAIIVI